jgi:mannonate dehydratase
MKCSAGLLTRGEAAPGSSGSLDQVREHWAKGPGGALSSGYDDEVMRQSARLLEPGSVTHEQLWAAYDYFLRAVVPVAEEAGVRIALHPDDPPISEVRGVPRIMGSPEAFERALSLVPSPYSGVTFCQGNFTLMTDDLPALIRQLGRDGRIFFLALPGCQGGRAQVCRSLPRRGPD